MFSKPLPPSNVALVFTDFFPLFYRTLLSGGWKVRWLWRTSPTSCCILSCRETTAAGFTPTRSVATPSPSALCRQSTRHSLPESSQKPRESTSCQGNYATVIISLKKLAEGFCTEPAVYLSAIKCYTPRGTPFSIYRILWPFSFSGHLAQAFFAVLLKTQAYQNFFWLRLSCFRLQLINQEVLTQRRPSRECEN